MDAVYIPTLPTILPEFDDGKRVAGTGLTTAMLANEWNEPPVKTRYVPVHSRRPHGTSENCHKKFIMHSMETSLINIPVPLTW